MDLHDVLIGYKIIGNGPQRVIMMHSLFCDSTLYDPILNYLDLDSFTYLFPDFRGYGLSKDIPGNYSLEERCLDIEFLLSHLDWNCCYGVGHALGSTVLQKFNIMHPGCIEKMVLLAPVNIGISKMPPLLVPFVNDALSGNDTNLYEVIDLAMGSRYKESIIKWQLKKIRSTTLAVVLGASVKIASTVNIHDIVKNNTVPVLVVTGSYDLEWYRLGMIHKLLMDCYNNIEFIELKEASHYPMYELPMYTVSLIESFFNKKTERLHACAECTTYVR
jgi:pimeloyl-ACP methyl ester carboxylesterase